MSAVLLQSVLGFEPHDGRWITGVLVGVDDPPRRMALSAQRSWRESAQPLLHRAWAREGSRSSHRWSRQPGKNTPTCPEPGAGKALGLGLRHSVRCDPRAPGVDRSN